MTTRLQLNLPDHTVPEWATNASRTLDPDTTLGDTVPVVKEDGWEVNTRPPAKIMNWLTHYVTEWLRPLTAVPLINWLANPDIGSADIDGIVYVPPSSADLEGQGTWTIAAGTFVYRGDTGTSWTSIATLTSAVNEGAFAISDSYDAIFGTANGLEYNSTGTTFVQVTNATIDAAFAGGVRCIDSNGDRTIVFDDVGLMRIAATGVNGSWASPTTPPVLGSLLGSSYSGRLIHVGGGKWFAARRDAGTQHISMSVDDGDNWTTKTVPPFSNANLAVLAYDPVSGRLVATGESSCYYSDDDGDTWTQATSPESEYAIDIYSCGGGIWVATTNRNTNDAQITISLDNAVTWQRAEMHDLYDSTEDPYYLMSDGRKLVVVGQSGLNGRTLAYPL